MIVFVKLMAVRCDLDVHLRCTEDLSPSLWIACAVTGSLRDGVSSVLRLRDIKWQVCKWIALHIASVS